MTACMPCNPMARVLSEGFRFSRNDFCNTSFFLFLFVCFFFSVRQPLNFKREPFPYVQALYSVIMNIGINHCQKYVMA